jgi:hypothetical protein
MQLWKIKTRFLYTLAYALRSDRIEERAMACEYRNTAAKKLTPKELERVRERLYYGVDTRRVRLLQPERSKDQ